MEQSQCHAHYPGTFIAFSLYNVWHSLVRKMKPVYFSETLIITTGTTRRFRSSGIYNLQSMATSLLGTDTVLNTVLLNTLSLRTPLNVSEQFSQRCNATGRFTVLCTLRQHTRSQTTLDQFVCEICAQSVNLAAVILYSGLISKSIQLQIQVTLESLGSCQEWKVCAATAVHINMFLQSEGWRCYYFSAYVATAITWLR
jgi:hypothetical protein